jgi:hypothetical protein
VHMFNSLDFRTINQSIRVAAYLSLQDQGHSRPSYAASLASVRNRAARTPSSHSFLAVFSQSWMTSSECSPRHGARRSLGSLKSAKRKGGKLYVTWPISG